MSESVAHFSAERWVGAVLLAGAVLVAGTVLLLTLIDGARDRRARARIRGGRR